MQHATQQRTGASQGEGLLRTGAGEQRRKRATLVISHQDTGTAVVRVIARAGVWAVTRSADDCGWVVTHAPSGCAMQYYGVRHRRALALKIMRALHRAAPDWRNDLSLLGVDLDGEARRIAKAEESAHIKAVLKRLYDEYKAGAR